MYTIYAITNGVEYPIHNPKSSRLIVGDPWYEVGDNINGSAEFTVYPEHPFYDRVHKLSSEIVIRNNGSEVFRGRVLYDDEAINGSKKVVCEGELAYLCDSVQRPKVYHNTSVSDYLADLLANHNSQVEAKKQFQIGIVTVVDNNDSLYRYSNWNSTRECLSDKLVDRLGGHLVVRWAGGTRYLDYLADNEYYRTASQKIEFGRNLLDFALNADATDIATCIIPLGAKLEEEDTNGEGSSAADNNLDNRLTIESVNDGADYVSDPLAVQEYGKIFKTVTNDDITTPSYLKSWGEEYLRSTQYEKLVLEVKAVDLGLQDTSIERFTSRDQIHCVSTPNGMDTWLPVSSMRFYLMRMEENTLTLGTSGALKTFTSASRATAATLEKTIEAIPAKSEIVQDALTKAQTIFNTQLANGYAHYLDNELIISDNPTLSESQRMWRWGLGGLAYSSTGYNGTFRTAWTMNGEFVADFITTGTLSANVIGSRSITADKIAANTITANEMNVGTLSAIAADVGTLTAGVLQSSNYSSGVSGMKLDLTNGTADITGKITSSSGSIGGWTITSNAIYRSNSAYGNSSGMYFGTSGLSIKDKFLVNSNGAATCLNLTVEDTFKMRSANGSLASPFSIDDAAGSVLSVNIPLYPTKRVTMFNNLELGYYNVKIGNEDAPAFYLSSSGTLFVGVGNDNTNTSSATYLRGGTVRIYAHQGGGVYLGSSGSTAITSDEQLKDINDIDSRYERFFMELCPVLYKYKRIGHRTHIGYGARAVEAALESAGLTTEEFAGILIDRNVTICADEAQTEADQHYNTLYSLRYEEFGALYAHMLQKTIRRLDALEARISQ